MTLQLSIFQKPGFYLNEEKHKGHLGVQRIPYMINIPRINLYQISEAEKKPTGQESARGRAIRKLIWNIIRITRPALTESLLPQTTFRRIINFPASPPLFLHN